MLLTNAHYVFLPSSNIQNFGEIQICVQFYSHCTVFTFQSLGEDWFGTANYFTNAFSELECLFHHVLKLFKKWQKCRIQRFDFTKKKSRAIQHRGYSRFFSWKHIANLQFLSFNEFLTFWNLKFWLLLSFVSESFWCAMTQYLLFFLPVTLPARKVPISRNLSVHHFILTF